MARPYVRKTTRRSREERHLSVRAVHLDPPDIEKLTQLLIRLTLQETGQARARREANRPPSTYRSTSDDCE